MDADKLQQGNRIQEQIEKLENDIEMARYTQVKDVLPRKSYLTFNGAKEPIEIPERMFRPLGLIILNELRNELHKVQTDILEL